MEKAARNQDKDEVGRLISMGHRNFSEAIIAAIEGFCKKYDKRLLEVLLSAIDVEDDQINNELKKFPTPSYRYTIDEYPITMKTATMLKGLIFMRDKFELKLGASSGPSVTERVVTEGSSTSKNSEDTERKAIATLQQENERMKMTTTCKICLGADVETVFLPCRHLVCCKQCANAVKDCPVCRRLILGTVKTFLA